MNELWLEYRTPATDWWQRFLPLEGLPLTSAEMRLILDGQVIRRVKTAFPLTWTEFRLERMTALEAVDGIA